MLETEALTLGQSPLLFSKWQWRKDCSVLLYAALRTAALQNRVYNGAEPQGQQVLNSAEFRVVDFFC